MGEAFPSAFIVSRFLENLSFPGPPTTRCLSSTTLNESSTPGKVQQRQKGLASWLRCKKEGDEQRTDLATQHQNRAIPEAERDRDLGPGFRADGQGRDLRFWPFRGEGLDGAQARRAGTGRCQVPQLEAGPRLLPSQAHQQLVRLPTSPRPCLSCRWCPHPPSPTGERLASPCGGAMKPGRPHHGAQSPIISPTSRPRER